MPWVLALLAASAQTGLTVWLAAIARERPGVPDATAFAAGAILALPHLAGVRIAGRYAGRRHPARNLAQGYLGAVFIGILVGLGVGGFLATAALVAATGMFGGEAWPFVRWGSVAVAVAIALPLLGGFASAHRHPVVRSQPLAVPGLAPALAGTTVAHLSDLHIGNGLEGPRLAALVDRVNALDADCVVLTGDLFDHDVAFAAEGTRALGRLRARAGVYAVLGNHDVFAGAAAIRDAFAREAPTIRLVGGLCLPLPLRAPLSVAGVDDAGPGGSGREIAALERLADARPDDGPTLLLVHRPEGFPTAVKLGFGAVLAGHYHGGQLAVPGFGGRWNVGRLFSPFPRGRYVRDGVTLSVSCGIGAAVPRLRVGSRPEIPLYALQPSDG